MSTKKNSEENTENKRYKKFQDSLKALEDALIHKDKVNSDTIYMLGISKAYEVALEYAWKYFKWCAEQEELEPYSPKESVKMAGQINLISDVALWLDFLKQRNLAVHDYIGVSDTSYLAVIQKFLTEAKKVR